MSGRLDWPRCLNVRDLGGTPTADGGQIKNGALIRSDSLHQLTAAGVETVIASGARTIIDLRTPEQRTVNPSPFCDAAVYRWISLPTATEEALTSRVGHYRILLDRYAPRVAEVIAEVAAAPPGVVVVHCQAGKDRTGLVVALALAVAGVQPQVIAADYAVSAECLRRFHQAELAGVYSPQDRALLVERQSTRPGTMLATLAHLTSQYGGVGPYLMAAGLDAVSLAALRSRLVEAPRSAAAQAGSSTTG